MAENTHGLSLRGINEEYFKQVRNIKFEEVIISNTMSVVLDMDKEVANEIRLRYITHVFARALDEVAEILIRHKEMN